MYNIHIPHHIHNSCNLRNLQLFLFYSSTHPPIFILSYHDSYDATNLLSFIFQPATLKENNYEVSPMSEHPFSYKIICSARKTLAIQITADATVCVRAPKNMDLSLIDSFLEEKEPWILKHLQNKKDAKENGYFHNQPLSDSDRIHYRKIARDIFTQKTAYYAKIMNVTYGRISIREQKTRWGSCSSIGNLNFNWRLIFAPEEVLDYVVVHELAHRKEMNHSSAFYNIIKGILPNYKNQQKWLRENGQKLWN